jgi:hypothetical protein
MIPSEIAKEISLRFSDASQQCDKSLRVVMSHQSLGEVKVLGTLVANFMGHSYLNILKPIWTAHPELEPAEMKGPHTPPSAELAPESRDALEAFLVAARSSIELAKQHLSEDEQKSLFAYGGMAEVVEATDAIADFLAKPRFRES